MSNLSICRDNRRYPPQMKIREFCWERVSPITYLVKPETLSSSRVKTIGRLSFGTILRRFRKADPSKLFYRRPAPLEILLFNVLVASLNSSITEEALSSFAE